MQGATTVQTTSHHTFNKPDETREFPNGKAEILSIDETPIGRLVLQPGWRWSNDVKPIAGTDSCQTRHTGICVSGTMTVKYDDGTEQEIGPGDVVVLEPGHDAWVTGDEPCVMYDTGVAAYAKPQ